jgi:hypothetical protein
MSSSLLVVRHRAGWLLAAGSLLVGQGCTSADEVDVASDEPAFAVSKVSDSTSILPDIERSNGAPEVCVGMIGFEAGAQAAAAARLETLIRDAASKWNALLRGNAQWSVQTDLAPRFHFQNEECSKRGAGLKVNVWGTSQGFKADYCKRPGYTCSSGAIPAYKTLYLGPWNRSAEADPFDPFATLHEYGHLLGLGDTYRIPGGNDWVGEQPDSVMNGKSQSLTDDDKLGLWVALRTLKTGVRSCEGFGDEIRMTKNSWNMLLCSPSAQPGNMHGTPVPPVPVDLPKAGTWAYEGFPLAQTGMLVSAVTETATGFTMNINGYTYGGKPAPTEALYRCDVAGACAAEVNGNYRIVVASATKLRLVTPNTPDGVQVDFAHP